MASLKSFFKNKDRFAQFNDKLDGSKLLSKQGDFVELAAKYIDILIALEKADKARKEQAEATGSDFETTLERLEKVASQDFITKSVGEIVADATEIRLSYLEGQLKKTVKAKKTGTVGSTHTAGTAYLNLDNHIKKMMAYNESAKQQDRVYVSISTSRKDKGNGVGKVRVRPVVTKAYFTENERAIITHNVEMGVFEDSVRYLNKDQKAHALRVARDCGYEK